ncbi:MAG: alpha/beta fold hydrolase [Peptococcaceae bacterium]|nr:alpha/beta fold hydrolase [Peptococcaceae bacterium]
MMKKRLFGKWLLPGVILLFLFAGCQEISPVNPEPYEEYSAEDPMALIAEKLVTNLTRNHYAACMTFFSETMQKALPEKKMRRAYEGMLRKTGAYQEIVRTECAQDEDYYIYTFTVNHEKQGMLVRVVLNGEKRVDGLWFDYTARTEGVALPEGVVEEDVIIDAGTGFPLSGKLTLPAHPTGPLTAVVLVQGSGSLDMDETIYSNKPFRDIAYGLAEKGIAVLRYDKRTYRYGERISAVGAELTVVQETLEDAVAAWAFLHREARMDPAKIYVLGHSLGGMLAPRIADETKTAGVIILAGSLRSLVDVIYDQNQHFIKQMPLTERAALLKEVEDEYARLPAVQGMSETEAKQETIFTLPAWYITEMDRYPAKGFLEGSAYPVLVLQGSKDFQIGEKDFDEYVLLAMTRPLMTTKLYPGLNHLFMPSTGGDNPNTDEYLVPSRVDPAVCEDIAAWMRSLP